jgi:hypothetical protein
LPDQLSELVQDYLPAVPIDPFDGQPIRYRRTDDGFLLYSVGADRTDDGGVMKRNTNKPDIVIEIDMPKSGAKISSSASGDREKSN